MIYVWKKSNCCDKCFDKPFAVAIKVKVRLIEPLAIRNCIKEVIDPSLIEAFHEGGLYGLDFLIKKF